MLGVHKKTSLPSRPPPLPTALQVTLHGVLALPVASVRALLGHLALQGHLALLVTMLLKMASILPTGQWYAPSAVIAWYCIVLHSIAWYCMVMHGIA